MPRYTVTIAYYRTDLLTVEVEADDHDHAQYIAEDAIDESGHSFENLADFFDEEWQGNKDSLEVVNVWEKHNG